MRSFSTTLLACSLICSCAASPAAPPAPAASPALELPPPEGWPDHYPPALVLEAKGIDARTGELLAFPKSYLLHRIDLEKLLVRDSDARSLEARLAEVVAASAPSFWDSAEGRLLIGAAGFAAGAGATVLIVWGVGSAAGR
jgi:hypothetical protein